VITFDLLAISGEAVGLMTTALLLGFRHGFDWDHIAAIADVTSTTATADAAEAVHEHEHVAHAELAHPHGGRPELAAHGRLAAPLAAEPPEPHGHVAALHHVHVGTAGAVGAAGVAGGTGGTAVLADHHVPVSVAQPSLLSEQRHAFTLGSLYALGHATVVAALGTLALVFGTVLPDWVDPIMGRVVGFTLLLLGAWVFVSLYQYIRHGTEFRLRSRWMLVFDSVRYAWRRLQARLHGHAHADPIEMSSYGAKTAFGVGMIHGIGAETGTQVLLIAAIGGAAGQGLGIPMMVAFIVGLLAANSIIVLITSTGFIASRLRERIYIAVGVVAGAFSLVIGLLFVFELEGSLPAIDRFLEGIGLR
jgi:high-affinity nickel-transport protein